MADAIKDLTKAGEKSMLLADQNELCDQPRRALVRFANIIPAIEKARERASNKAEVIVASAQTLAKPARLQEFVQNFPPDYITRIFVDECHRGADRAQKILSAFPKARVCGVTATPFRSDLRDLSKYYEEVCFSMPLVDLDGGYGLVEMGFAVPFKVLTLPMEIDLSDVGTSMTTDGRDYKPGDLETTIAPLYRQIARMLKAHAEGKQTIAFLPLISSSKAFAAICQEEGITARHIDGDSPDRKELILGFQERHFQVLTNSSVLSTGVDIPEAECFLNLTPTRSIGRYQQCYGRVMRVLPGVVDDLTEEHQANERRERIATSRKPFSLIFDLLWAHDRLGVIRPGHMLMGNPTDAQAFYEKVKKNLSPEDAREIARAVQADRENRIIEELEKAALRPSPEGFDSQVIGILVGDPDLAHYDPVNKRELIPPYPYQLATLRKFGINPETVKTYGLAKQLMNTCFHRIQDGLATLKQVSYLRALEKQKLPPEARHTNYGQVTFAEASACIGALRERRAA